MSSSIPTPESVAARFAITEVIHRYGRGIDSMDRAMILSCWHPGGTDDHAPLYSGSAEGFVEWWMPVHRAMRIASRAFTASLIELDGDKADAETSWSVVLQVNHAGARFDIMADGRYVDKLECIDGTWAFRHRSAVLDRHRIDPLGRTLADFAGNARVAQWAPGMLALQRTA